MVGERAKSTFHRARWTIAGGAGMVAAWSPAKAADGRGGRRSETDEPIRLPSLIRDPAERLRTLVAHAVLHQRGGLLAATLSAAAEHPLVRPVLQQVTAQRLRFIADAYAELGFPRPEAERRALLIYGVYVGSFHLMRAAPDRVMPEGELHRYVDDVVEALVPGPRGDDNQTGRRRR